MLQKKTGKKNSILSEGLCLISLNKWGTYTDILQVAAGLLGVCMHHVKKRKKKLYFHFFSKQLISRFTRLKIKDFFTYIPLPQLAPL